MWLRAQAFVRAFDAPETPECKISQGELSSPLRRAATRNEPRNTSSPEALHSCPLNRKREGSAYTFWAGRLGHCLILLLRVLDSFLAPYCRLCRTDADLRGPAPPGKYPQAQQPGSSLESSGYPDASFGKKRHGGQVANRGGFRINSLCKSWVENILG